MSLRALLSSRSLLRKTASRQTLYVARRSYAKPTTTLVADPTAGPMLEYQKSLPRLPVPALSATLDKYLKSVRPLIPDSEFAQTVDAVEEFRKSGGFGEQLQERLVAKANDPDTVNWLEHWWNDGAYFGYRDPVVVYVSYFFAYKDDKFRRTNASRAASIVTAALDFKKQVVGASLVPEYAKGEPLCMDSYKMMFNTCRLPKKPSDYAVTHDPTKNNHITVVRNNQYYILETEHEGKQLSTAELESQFAKIIAEVGDKRDAPIGALTADNRDFWADNRDLLLAAHPQNKELLEKIESSSFVVCLDDSKPVTRDQVSRGCWHGDGRNRFYDKPVQFIVFENGKAGFLGEHSSMDGTPTCRLSDYICDVNEKSKVDHGSPTVRENLPPAYKLNFQLNPTLNDAIAAAEKRFDTLINNHDLNVLAYNGYGKNLIKKFRVSPDAFAQMVIQLGYYKMFGVSRPTYESAQTRKFQHGRTETCRTVSADSIAWVKAQEDPNVSLEAKAKLFRTAIDSHVAYMADAVEGHGVDRHMLGLRKSLNPGEEAPRLFADPAFAYSSHWYLSTSQLSSEYFDGYGWGQVVNDGFGCAYMIKNNSLHFNVASVKDLEVHGTKYIGGTSELKHYLEEAADDIRYTLEAEAAASEPSKPKL